MGLVKTNVTARVWKGGENEDETNDTAFEEDRRGLYRKRRGGGKGKGTKR